MPNIEVASACGSASINSTRFPASPSATARFTAIVLLPVPPFWLATAILRTDPLTSDRPFVPATAGATVQASRRPGAQPSDLPGYLPANLAAYLALRQGEPEPATAVCKAVTAVTQRAQVPVALATEPLVGEVVDLEATARSAALAASAGPPDRLRPPRAPMRRAQVHPAIPGAISAQPGSPRQTAGAQRRARERQPQPGVRRKSHRRGQLIGSHALTAQRPSMRATRASVTCGPAGSAA